MKTSVLRFQRLLPFRSSSYCALSTTSTYDVIVPTAKLPTPYAPVVALIMRTKRVRRENKKAEKTGSGAQEEKERAERAKDPLSRARGTTRTMRSARARDSHRGVAIYREFSQCRAECVHSALEESSTVSPLTRGISCRATVDHTIDYLPTRSPLFSSSPGPRYASLHCLAHAADKPIAADANASDWRAVTISCAYALQFIRGTIRIVSRHFICRVTARRRAPRSTE